MRRYEGLLRYGEDARISYVTMAAPRYRSHEGRAKIENGTAKNSCSSWPRSENSISVCVPFQDVDMYFHPGMSASHRPCQLVRRRPSSLAVQAQIASSWLATG